MTLPRYDTVGSLAAALREATTNRREIERDVDELLGSLFVDWKPLFPADRGWQFHEPDRIDVYGAAESPAATDALHRAGFACVVTHEHASEAACSRYCTPRTTPAPALAMTEKS